MHVQAIKDMIKTMLWSGKLILVANTMPLFIIAQMFILSDHESSENDDQEVIINIRDLIERSVLAYRDQQTRVNQPLLNYYKMRNIIYTYTSLLNYMACKFLNRTRQEGV